MGEFGLSDTVELQHGSKGFGVDCYYELVMYTCFSVDYIVLLRWSVLLYRVG